MRRKDAFPEPLVRTIAFELIGPPPAMVVSTVGIWGWRLVLVDDATGGRGGSLCL
jgi:hypothetical protein